MATARIRGTNIKGSIYMLHFEKPISEVNGCQHYVGWASDVEARVAEHAAGTGARLTQVAKERGIGFRVVKIWEGTRNDERSFKNRHNTKKYCPVCQAQNGGEYVS